jgi:hypothetical protein
MIHKLVHTGLGLVAAIIPANMAISAELIAQNYPRNVINAGPDGNNVSSPVDNNPSKPAKRPRSQRPIFTESGKGKPFDGFTNSQPTYTSTPTPGQTVGAGGTTQYNPIPNQTIGAGTSRPAPSNPIRSPQ